MVYVSQSIFNIKQLSTSCFGINKSYSEALSALINGAATTTGHALAKIYGEKMTKHGEARMLAGMVFLPLPVETLGGWHDQTVSLVKRLGSALARQTGQEESEAIRHFSQRMAILLVKGNASMFLNRVPNFPPQEIDGLSD